MLTGASNGALQLWDVESGLELMRYRDRGVIESLFILPDGNRFVLWRTGAVIIIDLNNDNTLKALSGAYPSLSSDGQILQIEAGNQFDGYRIQHWDMNTYNLITHVTQE